MVTALVITPSGEQKFPRYELIVFDTLEECQTAFETPGFREYMWQTVKGAYPEDTVINLGCGQWDMGPQRDPSTKPKLQTQA